MRSLRIFFVVATLGATAVTAQNKMENQNEFAVAAAGRCETFAKGTTGVDPGVEGRIAKSEVEKWFLEADALPTECQVADTDDKRKACRDVLSPVFDRKFSAAVEEAAKALWKGVIEETDASDPQRIPRFDDLWVRSGRTFIHTSKAKAGTAFSTAVGGLGQAELAKNEELVAAAKKAADEATKTFETDCRKALNNIGAQFENPAAALVSAAEDKAYEELRKTSGFSRVVRCEWTMSNGARGAFRCLPGLRLGGEDQSSIIVSAPPGASVKRVRVASGEEVRLADACPSGSVVSGRQKLACDELEFSIGQVSVLVAVHKNRLFGPSYGRTLGFSLKGPSELLRVPGRRELSLVLEGKSPALLVSVELHDGTTVSSEVVVGYERWGVETGGFLAASSVVDEKLVTKLVSVTEGQTTVTKLEATDFRGASTYSQETGIFANFIPRNYESVGLGLGFSTSEAGRAPSVYFGPTIRLRTFGNRGIASFYGGWVLRSVDRFPEVVLGEKYSPEAAAIKAEKDQRIGRFIGIQLGFSFGPVSSADEE